MPIDKRHIKPEKRASDEAVAFVISEPLWGIEDLILSEESLDEIRNVIAMTSYSNRVYEEWGLKKVMKRPRSVSINFFGPSGTGKTMAAHAIAKSLNKRILLVNYAEIESKYVGETSKNLIKLFEYAQSKDTVIVFDEADALLSKRVTSMHSATDVSVNQTRNVLLRIFDSYEGIVIFTTNFFKNYDKAFIRRITNHIEISMPDLALRGKLWNHYLVDSLPIIGDREDLISNLAELEDLSGADISNVVLKAAIAAARENKPIDLPLLRREAEKVLKIKKSTQNDLGELKITTRKVSEEYVKEQAETGGILNGIT